jgi:hypothetical protein
MGTVKNSSKIDKCPDKNATIDYSYDIEFLGDVEGF